MPVIPPVNTSAGPNSTALKSRLYTAAQAGKHFTGGEIGYLDVTSATPLYPEWHLIKQTTGKTPAVLSINGGYLGTAQTNIAPTYDPWGNILFPMGPASPSRWGQALTNAAIQHAQAGGILSTTGPFLNNPTIFAGANSGSYNGTTKSVATINGSGTPGSPTGIINVASIGPFNAGGGFGLAPLTNPSANNVLHWFLYSGLGTNTLTGCWVDPRGFVPGWNTTVPSSQNLAGSSIALTLVPWGVTSGTLQIYNDAGSLQSITFTGIDTVNKLLTGCSGGTGTAGTGRLATIVSGWTIETAYQGTSSDNFSSGRGIINGGAHNTASGSALSASAATGAWPMQWSSTAHTTTGLGASTDYNAAQTPIANPCWNNQLDYFAQFAYQCAQLGIPVMLRMYGEPNLPGGPWWSYGRNCTWYSSAWKYTVGYLTGTHGFTGQPTCQSFSGLPLCTEILFEYCQAGSGGTWLRKASDPHGLPIDPSDGTTVLADLIGGDFYSTSSIVGQAGQGFTSTDFTADMLYQMSELYGNATTAPATTAPVPAGVTTDLSTLSGGTLSVVSASINNGPFAGPSGGGHLQVPTVNGWYSIPYTGWSTVSTNVVFTLGTIVGVPVGSNMLPGSLVVWDDTAANSGSAMVTSINAITHLAHWAAWDTQFPASSSLSLFAQPNGRALLTDANALSVEDISPPLPWAAGGALLTMR